MKSISCLLVLGLGATGALAATAANFLGSCDANSIKVSGRTLTANCKDIFGQSKCSKLDLNRCIKNNYGSLEADPTGAGPHLGDQCVQCSNSPQTTGFIVNGGPTLMHCQCNPGTGAAQANWPTAMFDLSQCNRKPLGGTAKHHVHHSN
ncbi:uncharacterized protein THITE_2043158 [Thermothielavioides terrestris NRRL 8126]|uniref:Cyanovirin-N domain-containing protein n=1 Tax=Thermothielavioides terrestris (strain ATCC 38088 / NRRL 8126) TaxID=578455 RepID=G2QWW8_THETT|nr:uncharacterized protein THITE_2043158 [Thermothielavioides terrestris NRRL 8126]AEO63132.1 hypothetical protein THITE_2043158 [Thermothielavioides terrestris NRRL 8126]